MKASAPTLSASPSSEKAGVGTILELTKARLTSLVLLTTFVGFYLGSRGTPDYAVLLHAMIATALVAGGAAALNQFLERDHDAKMPRTAGRPLPSGKIQPETVLVFGTTCAVIGLVYLAIAVNLLTSILGAVTLVSYLFVYTPLKRTTPLNTIVGAIPGALPPVMGWAASRGDTTLEGWLLFAVLFTWQIPHFLAIAWIYKDDYARAGFAMLPVVDPSGNRTCRHVLMFSVGLLVASLGPFWIGVGGVVYLAGALILNAAFLAMAIRFCMNLNKANARQLFFASIIFLPLELTLMMIDKAK